MTPPTSTGPQPAFLPAAFPPAPIEDPGTIAPAPNGTM